MSKKKDFTVTMQTEERRGTVKMIGRNYFRQFDGTATLDEIQKWIDSILRAKPKETLAWIHLV